MRNPNKKECFSKFLIDKIYNSHYNGSCPFGKKYGGIAQLVEHSVHTRSVTGSSPVAATKKVFITFLSGASASAMARWSSG